MIEFDEKNTKQRDREVEDEAAVKIFANVREVVQCSLGFRLRKNFVFSRMKICCHKCQTLNTATTTIIDRTRVLLEISGLTTERVLH